MKKSIIFIFTFHICVSLFGQISIEDLIVSNVKSKVNNVIDVRTDSMGNVFKKYLFKFESDYKIYSMKNDTLDGDLYWFYSSGRLFCSMNFNQGKLWNVTSLFDTAGNYLYPGTLHDGNGYIVRYYPLLGSKNVQENGYATCRVYFKDGYYTGTMEYYDCEGNLFLVKRRTTPYSNLFSLLKANIYDNSYERTDSFPYQVYLVDLLPDTTYYLLKHNIVFCYVLPRTTSDRLYPLGSESLYVLGDYGTESDFLFLDRNRRKLIKMEKRHYIDYGIYIEEHLFTNCYESSFKAIDRMPFR